MHCTFRTITMHCVMPFLSISIDTSASLCANNKSCNADYVKYKTALYIENTLNTLIKHCLNILTIAAGHYT